MTTDVLGASSDDVRAHIAHVLDVTRDGLRRCLHERKMRMDEVFGYVHWENGLGAVVFVLPLTMRPEIVAEVAKNNPAEYAEMFSASIMRLDSEPAQGKLRTLIESHLGLFEVAVQMYPGAVA